MTSGCRWVRGLVVGLLFTWGGAAWTAPGARAEDRPEGVSNAGGGSDIERPREPAREAGARWLESAGAVDFGVVEFGFAGSSREWNVGIGRAAGFAPRSRWSFVGAGLSVTRGPHDDPFAPPVRRPLEGVEVKPWAGGCVNCPLGEIVQLGLELKWAPGGAALLQDEETGPEGRAGVSLWVRW